MTRFFNELATSVASTNANVANSALQFNATAKNQMTQFSDELVLTAETFNADQINELSKFDAEQSNIISQFNSEMKNQRQMFNANNQLAIDSSNVQWRRDINTANTAASNAALQFDAQNLLGIQQSALNNIWNHYDSLLNLSFQTEQSTLDRAQAMIISAMNQEMQQKIADETSWSSIISGGFAAATSFAGSDGGSKLIQNWVDGDN